MKTKVLKITIFFLLLVGLTMVGSNNVFAVKDPAEILIPDNIDGDKELEEIGEQVLGIVTVVGYAMAIIISISIGIKYITGSVEEKAGYKKSMIPYIVGCVILVAAPTLTNIVYNSSKSFLTSEVVYTSYCETCMTVATNCKDKKSHYMTPCYYCTRCEKTSAKTCSTCGAVYKDE